MRLCDVTLLTHPPDMKYCFFFSHYDTSINSHWNVFSIFLFLNFHISNIAFVLFSFPFPLLPQRNSAKMSAVNLKINIQWYSSLIPKGEGVVFITKTFLVL